MDFTTELRSLLNRHNKENGSNTPDFILANFLEQCLSAFDRATNHRKIWYTEDIEREATDEQ